MKLEINQILVENKIFIEQNKEIIDNVFDENNKLLDFWKNKLPIYEFHTK